MSLESVKTMKQNSSHNCECRRGWIRLGKGVSSFARRVRESRNNRCYASNHRHGGVCEVGMLRSEIKTSREIPRSVEEWHDSDTTTHTSPCKVSVASGEVGMVHSSDETPVMGVERRSHT